MLDFLSRTQSRDCEGVSRRDFLRVGAIGASGLSLPWLLQQRSLGETAGYLRDKSVVMLFLSGGASHIETFNPNMQGPAPSRSTTGEVATTVPGTTFGGTFPLLAKHAHQMALVRSFHHPIGGHTQAIVHVLTGGTDPNGQRQSGFSMGSAYSKLRGANHAETGMPTYSLLNSEEVDPQYRSEHGRVERGSHSGSLGAVSAPFIPGSKGPTVENMKLRISADRLDDRRALLSRIDSARRDVDDVIEYEGAERYTEQAFDVILGSAAEAFDISREDPRLAARYDTSHISVGKKKFRPSQLGRHMLTARRLIEAGCGYVTVHSAGWDMHADGNNPGIVAGMEMLGRPVDRAVSAFVEDLENRGLLDKVLLVITGDFGRTPKVNGRGGRDHWPRLCTLAFAGGGMGRGQVIGRSARDNGQPDSDPVNASHLLATIMHSVFDMGRLRAARGVPRGLLQQLDRPQPIPGLIS
ncbi:MAG: DUF1501 domain-containing protein [Pirellulaceae bacterium]|jgi:hypothetical protein|nr:DUF1501 domain-containing protein [Pirellulaceae bacterium]